MGPDEDDGPTESGDDTGVKLLSDGADQGEMDITKSKLESVENST